MNELIPHCVSHRLKWKFIISHKVLLNAQMAFLVVNSENSSSLPHCQQNNLLQTPLARVSLFKLCLRNLHLSQGKAYEPGLESEGPQSGSSPSLQVNPAPRWAGFKLKATSFRVRKGK